jgi:hypothetical protein
MRLSLPLALALLASPLAACHAHSESHDAAPAPVAESVPSSSGGAQIATSGASDAGASAASPGLPPMPQPTGYLERRADGTCWWNHGMYWCPPGAMCKPTPPASSNCGP